MNTSDTLSNSEKADALRSAAAELRKQLDPRPLDREYKALQYVIRILTARESFFRKTTEFIGQIFS